MIRFEVTGATPEEFAEQLFRTLGVQINLHRVLPATSPTPSPSPQAMLMPSTSSSGEMHGSESSSTASKEIIATTTNPAKVHSDPVDDLWKATSSENQPPASSAPSTSTTSAKSGQKTKGPKLDDLKTRLSEVIVAATARWDQKRANAYARKLLKDFGVEKLGELKPEQYPSFDVTAEYYVTGQAPE